MDGLELRRKRALYRAAHRGTKELDLILGRFAEDRVPKMDETGLAAFERLLMVPDPDIDRWFHGEPAPENYAECIAELRAFFRMSS